MNKRKLLICTVLAIFIVAISLSAVSASSNKKVKSVTLKIKKQQTDYKLRNGDTISYIYEPKNNMGYPKGVTVETFKKDKSGGLTNSKHTKLTKATVWFKKKNKIIKKSSSKIKYDFIRIKLVKGYKPYKLKVYYKTK